MEVKQVVVVSNWPILAAMPVEVAKAVSDDTLVGKMYEVYDVDEFVEWCADSTTWVTLWPEGEEN